MKTILIWITLLILNSPLLAQTDLSKIYDIDTLQLILTEAKAQKDSQIIGETAHQIASVTEWINRDTDAESLDLIALSIQCFEATGDSLSLFKSRSALVGYYIDAKRWEEAEKLLKGNITFCEYRQDSSGMVHNIHSLARVYEGKGAIETAQEYYSKALEINQVVKDTLIELLTLYSQSCNYQQQQKYQEGIAAARKSAILSKALWREDFEALNIFQIGILYQYSQQLDSAIFYIQLAEKMTLDKPYSSLRHRCYLHLSDCYNYKKDFEKAFYFSRRYASLLDSIAQKERNNELDKLTIAYETKENQAAIQQLKKDKKDSEIKDEQKNQFLILLSASSLILFILFGFVIKFYRDKIQKGKIIVQQSKTLNQQKIKSLEDNLQITAIKSMLDGQEKERARIARDLHDSVGGMLSIIKLQIEDKTGKTHQLLDKMATEVRNIAQNLQPSALQKLGFIPAILDLIDFHQLKKETPIITFQHFKISKNLDKNIALHFYRFIQEALQNAIKHSEATEILIQINGEEDGISILVEDNGKGFDTQNTAQGSGLKNIQKRAEFLKADLTIESGETGTSLFLVWKNII